MGHFALNTLYLFLIVVGRYFAIVGVAYYFCYVRHAKDWAHKKINPEKQPREIIRSEIYWSVLTSGLFAVAGAVLVWTWENGYTRLYMDPGEYGYLYLVLSIPLLMFIHDTYFYWMHRLVHLKPFYQSVHKVHHESRDPSPFAAFSFHPWEALLEAIILPLLALLIPIHVGVFLTFLMVMTVLSVVNHLGYELFPAGFARWPVARYLITATNHTLHHKTIRWNYGLYFTIWDQWMGTHHPTYEDIYDEVKSRQPSAG